ncbi:uncharacterized protein STEHIDRAFT_149083 [Stereum hirsutum FP-91666 SS1]|uniref:uncharacterized protein n=1 Tax=Stereum hirsutum (strain FP-91666) TaxID=721885 RepID=UPI0004449687|nr:uncharacterized protein STEHIDRAFT_149083 [Stereum hirsutum FP-91666 SS1]EIM83619.1 hypothetical protein STEHIDRAFT_149083 [Stereum hirsutum FP-91666 SS1]
MADDTSKVKAKADTLSNSLSQLESTLEPLFAKSLPETTLGLDTIQQAKLQVAIPYLVYDLVFIYLKTRGIDPKTHPVIAELDRIRQYFDKIKEAEDPAKRSLVVDKAAAGRFIKHAISQARALADPPAPSVPGPSTSTSTSTSTPSAANVTVPVKVTAKMLARAQYEKEMREADEAGEEEDDEGLEMYDGEGDVGVEYEDESGVASDGSTGKKNKGKGKALEIDDDAPEVATIGSKRRRPPVDVFAGYGEDTLGSATPTTTTPGPPTATKRVKLQAVENDDAASSGSGWNTPVDTSDGNSKSKKGGKKKKKSKASPISG